MRPFPPFSLFLSLSLVCLSSAAPRGLKLRQSVTPPRYWTNVGRAPSTHGIQLHIALPQPRFPELEQHLAEISDPFHERYGEHLSKEEVEELVAPHQSSVEAVREWLASHGIRGDACHQSPAGDWVTVHVPVAQAEKMLGTVCHCCLIAASLLLTRVVVSQEFSVWKHDKDGDVLVRTTEYSLPSHLDEHVELIQPTTAFHRAKGLRSTLRFSPLAEVSPSSADAKITIPGSAVSVDASCNSTITVSCLKQLYNVVNYVPKAAHNNSIALTGYLDQFANFADLRKFYVDQVPAAVNTSFNVVLINGVCHNHLFSYPEMMILVTNSILPCNIKAA
jgi:tripeptidyl-peptidase-1